MNKIFNQDQLNGMLRIAVPAVCAWLAARGFDWFSDQAVQANIVMVLVALAALAWSWFEHSNAAKLQKAAKLDPAIEIKVPAKLVADDPGVASVVDSRQTPNVVEIKK